MSLAILLPYAQVILAVLVVAGVLLQQTGAGIGGAFGGSDNFSSGFHTRRGFEKFLFRGTITLSILFVLSTFLALMLK